MYVQTTLTKVSRSAKSPPPKKKFEHTTHSTFFAIFLILSSNCSQFTSCWIYRDPDPFTSLLGPYASAHFYFHFFSYPTYRLHGLLLRPLSYFILSVPRKYWFANTRLRSNWPWRKITRLKLGQLHIPGYQHELAWPGNAAKHFCFLRSKGISNFLWFTVTLINLLL